MNLVGACLLASAATITESWSFVVLNVVWALVALWALLRADAPALSRSASASTCRVVGDALAVALLPEPPPVVAEVDEVAPRAAVDDAAPVVGVDVVRPRPAVDDVASVAGVDCSRAPCRPRSGRRRSSAGSGCSCPTARRPRAAADRVAPVAAEQLVAAVRAADRRRLIVAVDDELPVDRGQPLWLTLAVAAGAASRARSASAVGRPMPSGFPRSGRPSTTIPATAIDIRTPREHHPPHGHSRSHRRAGSPQGHHSTTRSATASTTPRTTCSRRRRG